MLTVNKEIEDKIISSLGSLTDESGGLLGSSTGDTIDAFFFDAGKECSSKEYNPDVELLQNQLEIWDEDQIEFMGIIHSHAQKEELSAKDVYMARMILNVNSLETIIMPVFVLSEKKIIWYEVGNKHVKRLDTQIKK